MGWDSQSQNIWEYMSTFNLSTILLKPIFFWYIYLEPKWPLFWLEFRPCFGGVDLQQIEVSLVPGLYIQYIVSIAKIINTLTIFNIMIVLIENSLPAQFRGNGVLPGGQARNIHVLLGAHLLYHLIHHYPFMTCQAIGSQINPSGQEISQLQGMIPDCSGMKFPIIGPLWTGQP